MNALLKRASILAGGATILTAQRVRADRPSQSGAAVDTAAAVAHLAGCYELRGPTRRIVVRLLTSRSGPGWWGARDVRGENTPGNWWTWAPINSSQLAIEWGGIDGALSYVVRRRHGAWVGRETFHSGNNGGSTTTQPIHVRQVRCGPATG